MLDARPYSPEQACFPAVAQIGKVFRKTSGRRPETVYVLSSREPSAMNAEQWLVALRQYWGIENGVHQRVDASANEDRSRVSPHISHPIAGSQWRVAFRGGTVKWGDDTATGRPIERCRGLTMAV